MKEIGDEWIASTADEVISVGEPLPRIAAVQVSDGRRVQVTWRDGRSVIVDLAPVLLSHRHSIPLRDNDELFQTVRVNDDGVALEGMAASNSPPNGSNGCRRPAWTTPNSGRS